MGDRDYPDSPILQVLRFGAREERGFCPMFALLCLRTARWARAGVPPCATWHPGIFPTAERHGLLLRTEVDTGAAVCKGAGYVLMQQNSAFAEWRKQRGREKRKVMKTSAKAKTHTHTHTRRYVSSGRELLLATNWNNQFLVFMCSPVWPIKPGFQFASGSTSIGSMESMPCRWRSTTNWVVSPSYSGAGLTWWKMMKMRLPGRLSRRKHSNGFASSFRCMAR